MIWNNTNFVLMYATIESLKDCTNFNWCNISLQSILAKKVLVQDEHSVQYICPETSTAMYNIIHLLLAVTGCTSYCHTCRHNKKKTLLLAPIHDPKERGVIGP